MQSIIEMTKYRLLHLLILLNIMASMCFRPLPLHCECNERLIYRQYLLGLRKTRRLLPNAQYLIQNYTNLTNLPITLNNTDIGAKNIIMGNIVLDVSNVKEIHITTSNDKLIVELDKQKKNVNILEGLHNLNNIDTIIGTLSLLGKITNMN